MEFSEEVIKARLLYHLRKKKVMGGVHTHYDTLTRGFPSHLGKQVKDIAKQLVKENWLTAKPTSYGLQVSLNKEFLPEIEAYIMKVLNFRF